MSQCDKDDIRDVEQREDVLSAKQDLQFRTLKGVDPDKLEVFLGFEAMGEEARGRKNKKLVRKVDFRLLPLLILMNFLNYLDKNNLSQARLGGLEKSLGMHGDQFNTCTSIFFAGYLVFQLPTNLFLTRIKPSYFLGIAMLCWGAISIGQGFLHNYKGLLALRLLLGVFEAPFFPGSIFLLSAWYTRKELAHRVAWFFAGISLSNMFGGLLAAAVLDTLDGAHGLDGWRWLFIIEACMTMGVGVASVLLLPNFPRTTRWFTEDEKDFAEWRLINDAREVDNTESHTVFQGIALAFKDSLLYLFVLLQLLSLLSQSFQYFFPTIVDTLGYGKIQTLLITAPVWFVTFIVGLAVTHTSGHSDDRTIHITVLQLIACAGYILITFTNSTGPRFLGMFLLPLGAVSSYQIVLSWIASSFSRPAVKRAAAIAVCNVVGNVGNIIGPYMYPGSDGPQYVSAGGAGIGFTVAIILLSWVIRMVLVRANKKLKRDEETSVEDDNNGEERGLGFRYVY